MNENLISVCMPVYNVSAYIEQTLNSILNQSYKNIEILIGDNCSTDDTYEKLLTYAKKDQRIKIFRHNQNKGFSGNVNTLIKNAKADFITIYHGDDIYEPDIIEKEFRCISQSSDIGAVFTKMRYFTKRNTYRDYRQESNVEKLLEINSEELYIYRNLTQYLIPLMLIGNFFTCPSMMIRKETYYKINGFREDYTGNQDLDFWLRVLANGYRIGYVRKELLNYRTSPQQGSVTLEKGEYGVLRKNQLKLIDFYLNQHRQQIDPRFIKKYQQRKSRIYLDIAWHKLKNKDRSFVEDYATSLSEYSFAWFNKIGIKQRLIGLF